MGTVDPDALPHTVRPSPAALSTVTAAALVGRSFREALSTRRIVAFSVVVNTLGPIKRPGKAAQLYPGYSCRYRLRFAVDRGCRTTRMLCPSINNRK